MHAQACIIATKSKFAIDQWIPKASTEPRALLQASSPFMHQGEAALNNAPAQIEKLKSQHVYPSDLDSNVV